VTSPTGASMTVEPLPVVVTVLPAGTAVTVAVPVPELSSVTSPTGALMTVEPVPVVATVLPAGMAVTVAVPVPELSFQLGTGPSETDMDTETGRETE
jgi:hypothetical protein